MDTRMSGSPEYSFYVAAILFFAAIMKLLHRFDLASVALSTADIVIALIIVGFRRRRWSQYVTLAVFTIFIAVALTNYIIKDDCRCIGALSLTSSAMLVLNLSVVAITLVLLTISKKHSMQPVQAKGHIAGGILMILLVTLIVTKGGYNVDSTNDSSDIIGMVRELNGGNPVIYLDPWCDECQRVIQELIDTHDDYPDILVVTADEVVTKSFRALSNRYRTQPLKTARLSQFNVPVLFDSEGDSLVVKRSKSAILNYLASRKAVQ